MPRTVVRISAIGTRGEAEGKTFEAKPDASGRFVLNHKRPSGSTPATNNAASKVYVSTLEEAAALLSTNDYLINVISADGKRALREFRKVKIEYR
jgi:hypothetical protein